MSQHDKNTRINGRASDISETRKAAQNAPSIWSQTTESFRIFFGEDVYQKWIACLRFIAVVDDAPVIAAPGKLSFDRVQRQHLTDLQACWNEADPEERELKLIDWKRAPKSLTALVENPWAAPAPVSEEAAAEPEYTFDTLVAGDSNAKAVACAKRFASGAASGAPILFMFGLQGVGKTHIMQAIREAALASLRVTYMTAEEFMSAYIQGARTRDTSALKAKLRNCDLLLIDDLQWIKDKKGTDEAFFGNLRAVIGNGGKVVLTADEAPGDMKGLSQRLHNELKGAASIKVDLPDDEMRAEILRRKAALIRKADPNFIISEEMIESIVTRVSGPGRVLCGVLWSLHTESCFGEEKITMDMLNTVIRRQEGALRPLTIELIKSAAAATFGVTKTNLECASKAQAYVRPRQIAMFACRTMTDKSYPQIARKFGGRDHSTVLYSFNKINDARLTDADLARDIERLTAAIHELQRNAPN